MEERLQKILARAGLGSRRACEELIAAGRVRINGQVATLGTKANPRSDRIEVDGRLISISDEMICIALNKPRGVISTVADPDRRQTVRDLVPISGHLYPVGRLDVDSEGLILLTNDGDLTNFLTHPKYGHEKEYRVLVARRPDNEQLETWRRGVVLVDGYHTAPANVRFESASGKGAWLRIVMREGRKRQIRETGSLIGLPVVKIIRVRIGNLYLGNLKPREWRYLSREEVLALKEPASFRSKPAKSSPEPKKSDFSSRGRRKPGTSQRTPGKGKRR